MRSHAPRPDPMLLATAERADLADLLDSLTDEQWEAPTLCEGWCVREVVAHVVSYEELGAAGGLRRFLRCGFSFDRANAAGLREYGRRSPDELRDLLRRHLRPSGLTAIRKGGVGLTDGMVHHQDIRRALGMPREIPAERLLPTIEFALRAPALPSRRAADGLGLRATDLDWSHGSGPAVRGPGEALLMAVAGRSAALDDLEGDGVGLFRERLVELRARGA
ncbi:maleylpyruvate isomerase family mycothiol-dependent enzyme [Streptomyces sp. NPDC006422]|uniref:maleylpyruvate isomerase family mycothiol-dependent enzyme n=1 Tax=unclassified Streptomyces TaxID=2593676 RepID=UPI0033AF38DA